MATTATELPKAASNGGSPPSASAQPSEGSLRGSIVSIATPALALAACSFAGLAANYIPGLTLDPAQITAVMVAVLSAVLATGWKWLQGWQRHEQRVCAGMAQPIRAPKPTK